ncbi:MAG: hypothetical protein H6849_03355 [Alphaproteobacteria bacterium]|nr:MAG: hypothetical protein H6849_03355 [Alphaproteobacteria bacterium]
MHGILSSMGGVIRRGHKALLSLEYQAFGLIEACVSLIILGVILSLGLRYNTVQTQRIKAHQYNQVRAEIKRSFRTYYIVNRSYPLPCGASDRGVSPEHGETQVFYKNFLPYKTLGILSRMSESPFMYAVWGSATTVPPAAIIHTASIDTASVDLGDQAPIQAPSLIDGGFTVLDSTRTNIIDPRHQKIVVIVASADTLKRLTHKGELTLSPAERRNVILITQAKAKKP